MPLIGQRLPPRTPTIPAPARAVNSASRSEKRVKGSRASAIRVSQLLHGRDMAAPDGRCYPPDGQDESRSERAVVSAIIARGLRTKARSRRDVETEAFEQTVKR